MKRNVVWIVGGVLVVSILVVTNLMRNGNKQSSQSHTQTQPNQEKNGELQGSIWDILRTGTTQKCAFLTDKGESTVSQGDIYVSGNRMRVNFVTDLENQTGIENHMVKDGDYVYTWAETAKSGAKFKIDPNSETSWNASSPPEGLSNLSKNLKYSCETWEEDDDEFKLPENVNFIDISVK
jgi:hypothetical protein